MSERLPHGYTHVTKYQDLDVPSDWPKRFAARMPIYRGPPTAAATIVRCSRCDQRVYRSLRARDNMPSICYDCLEAVGIQTS